MKVGIFDSGVGGITVLKEAMKAMPQIEYIYYTDNLHVPYGTKPKEEVFGFVKDIVDFLVKEEVDAIVIACNTATCVAVQTLRELYDLPIIGMEPAVKVALDDNMAGKVLVTATPLTLKSDKYQSLIRHTDTEHRSVPLPLPELVTFAEQMDFDEEKIADYFREKFNGYDLSEFNGIVLGCTHFIYFKKYLEAILPPHMKIYDGNKGTVRHLKECLGINDENTSANIQSTKVDFYYSGKKHESLELLESYLNLV